MKVAPFPRMHVSLYVSDIAKTINFYNLFFRHEPVKIRKGYTKYVLDEPALIISFVENPGRVQEHFGHLGFQLETLAELNERLRTAQQAGLIAREEIGTNCCFANQDKFWVSDPDGVQWEVYYFHADAEFNDPQLLPELCKRKLKILTCQQRIAPRPQKEKDWVFLIAFLPFGYF